MRIRSSRSGLSCRISCFAAVLAVLAIEATAGSAVIGSVVAGDGIPGPWLTPYGAVPPSIVYDSFGRCLSPMNCPSYEQMRRFLERYERNYGQRFAPDKPAADLPGARRDVAATPESHIQPRYRAASQLRPEFEPAGKRPAANSRTAE